MKEQVKKAIINENLSLFTSKWIVERIPFIFKNDLEKYIIWKQKLSDLIGVDTKSISITGSAAVGVSLNPAKNFKDFDDQSDVDVAIISSHHFDISWHSLRNMGTRKYRLQPKERSSIEDHKTRLIYWGTIATDKIVQILPFGTEWLKAIDEMRNLDPTKDREINFRIYKDFEALRAYQNDSVNKLKNKLINI